ncbi:hypothetical protein G7Y89_g4743 [Cudoniella acicularis]|uniref:Uncharacterized protein n=1 Tax=Cudoniella acicularis TaxID=354080 RepID=A0A8H4RQA6_9HELO|nr:hypothetical protein G7Y89_g4743 [Cudoniella acicularis]
MIMKPDELPYHSSAEGSAVKGDGRSTVTHGQDGAKITPIPPNTTSQVSVPVPNPPSNTARLMRAKVECSGSNGGTITQLQVVYGNENILTTSVPDGDVVFEICPDISDILDSEPHDIEVILKLSLPHHNSSIMIQSITLGFGESTLEDIG